MAIQPVIMKLPPSFNNLRIYTESKGWQLCLDSFNHSMNGRFEMILLFTKEGIGFRAKCDTWSNWTIGETWIKLDILDILRKIIEEFPNGFTYSAFQEILDINRS